MKIIIFRENGDLVRYDVLFFQDKEGIIYYFNKHGQTSVFTMTTHEKVAFGDEFIENAWNTHSLIAVHIDGDTDL